MEVKLYVSKRTLRKYLYCCRFVFLLLLFLQACSPPDVVVVFLRVEAWVERREAVRRLVRVKAFEAVPLPVLGHGRYDRGHPGNLEDDAGGEERTNAKSELFLKPPKI